jgi:hypothetical protein
MPTFTQIGAAVVVGSGGQAAIDFTAIPATFTDLVIKISARCDSTGGYPETLNLKFNSSATTDYSFRGLFSVTATPGSNNSSSLTSMRAGSIAVVATTANTFSNIEIYIPNYASTSYQKSVSIDATQESNSTVDFNYALIFNAGFRSNTAAITSINLTSAAGNFVQHSTAYLYGVSNA